MSVVKHCLLGTKPQRGDIYQNGGRVSPLWGLIIDKQCFTTDMSPLRGFSNTILRKS